MEIGGTPNLGWGCQWLTRKDNRDKIYVMNKYQILCVHSINIHWVSTMYCRHYLHYLKIKSRVIFPSHSYLL